MCLACWTPTELGQGGQVHKWANLSNCDKELEGYVEPTYLGRPMQQAQVY